MTADVRCPQCFAEVEEEDGSLVCAGCGSRFARVDGIRVLVANAERGANGQAAWFDEAVDAEFEIERPEGLPRLYGWLLREKFRRSVAGLDLGGASVLVVCGGSGMDAEFLARAGADVVTSDVSLGAARRARERARRHGVRFEAIVADVEHLPFADSSFDVVYVHDGLHHIEEPLTGLAEMARVARRAVCITEPARAAATAVAARVGLAQDVEDAGNRVARLTIAEVQKALEHAGFRLTQGRRYAMLYRHEPRVFMRAASLRGCFPLAVAGFVVLNAAVGRAGNKLVATAVRVAERDGTHAG